MKEEIILILIPAAMVIFKIFESIIKKLMSNKKGHSYLTDIEREWLKSLYDWHDKTDLSGRKLWYFPPSILDSQDQIGDILRDVSKSQKDISEIIKEVLHSQKEISLILEKLILKYER